MEKQYIREDPKRQAVIDFTTRWLEQEEPVRMRGDHQTPPTTYRSLLPAETKIANKKYQL